MTTATTAVSNLIAKITQRPKSEQQKLEALLSRTIPHLTAERELITTSREGIRLWGDVVEDYNVIHRIPDKAIEYGKKYGLPIRDTPIMGTHTAAYAEQFAERLIQIVKDYDKKDLGLKITGLSIKFSDFVYPEEGIRWQVDSPKGSAVAIPVSGNVNGREIADADVKIGLKYNAPIELERKPVYVRDKFILDKERLEDSHKCVASNDHSKVPHMLPSAFVISTLLSILREQTGRTSGIYGSMDFDYITKPQLGQDVSVKILPARKPREVKNPDLNDPQYFYIINSICSQNNRQIAKGKVLVTTPYLINLTEPLNQLSTATYKAQSPRLS